ncbi:hypothetical protein LRP30_06165 [Bradyrhizobium sp. C-145]|uniref:hypothetical protein n=1 Tax=Bradyrhizobium sp. C-145 TaxID=574727 RepID=UPI00201B8035|nr:hypothetical protein [Bradyrhizobium sp. C-145]UQR64882.1 hypothetical protein LRP30_06165 [Bradyrhizobium sp. C-145]
MMRHIARPAHTREVHLFWRTSELSADGVDATHDDGQQILEIVCHTAGKLSHDFNLRPCQSASFVFMPCATSSATRSSGCVQFAKSAARGGGLAPGVEQLPVHSAAGRRR